MEEKNNIYKKLMAVQTELKAPKGQYNKFGGYSYRSCEDILEAVKPLLSQHGLVLTIADEIKTVGDRFYVQAEALLIDVDNDDSIKTSAYAREALARKGMDDSQVTGSASSYARKYALNGLFCIDDNKDADTWNNAPHSRSNARNDSPKGNFTPRRDDRPKKPRLARLRRKKSLHLLTTITSLSLTGPERTRRSCSSGRCSKKNSTRGISKNCPLQRPRPSTKT